MWRWQRMHKCCAVAELWRDHDRAGHRRAPDLPMPAEMKAAAPKNANVSRPIVTTAAGTRLVRARGAAAAPSEPLYAG